MKNFSSAVLKQYKMMLLKMIFAYHHSAAFLFGILSMISCSYGYGKETSSVSKNRVMSIQEFKKAIDNNYFLRKRLQTTIDQPLDEDEIEVIELARKNEDSHFGGKFEPGREIHNFTGDTLLVGGGKIPGSLGENDGKAILIDYTVEESETIDLVKNLRSGKWTNDPYAGREFKSEDEKNLYIKDLEEKLVVYKEAFKEKNQDILDRYYTLNIEKKIFPDILASITSEHDMNNIPDNKFMHVEFENVPCDVFLNPKIYSILERITKPEGTITFSISYACRRLIVPVIQQTKFGRQFFKILKNDMYDKLERMGPLHGSCNIKVKNR
jgi:hypothetical protein